MPRTRRYIFNTLATVSLLLMVAIVTIGCNQSQTNQIDVQQLKQVILRDVEGMRGGRTLWITAEGKAICSIVTGGKGGLHEIRYTFDVSEEQRSNLLDLINKHRFFSIQTKNRYGEPGETRPRIFIKSESGEYAVAKWIGDNHEDFDPIYQHLLKIAETRKNGEIIFQGTFDWDWKPEGFPSNKRIVALTNPKVE